MIVKLKRPHELQGQFIRHPAKRKVVRAGRRSGKTTGVAILAVEKFLDGHRILYATPTQDQIDKFWQECKAALIEPIERGLFYKNETRHIIELAGTEQRIRAKTAWDADSLRGDYADLLILDEWQLMKEDAWGRVGAPMLLDNDGDAVFIYTPPSLLSAARSRARDPRHAAKMFKRAEADETGRWHTFHFSSHDNPYISRDALADITIDMTDYAYRQEIMAEDLEEAPGALWKRAAMLDAHRVTAHPPLERVVVGVDPHTSTGETGIVAAGIATIGGVIHGYLLEDATTGGSPATWALQTIATYNRHQADRIIGESNQGGDMVEQTIRSVEGGTEVAYKKVWASRGKQARAEPVAALYEQGRIHHVGIFGMLEDELCTWEPGRGMPSPNRLDALVWAFTDLIVGGKKWREIEFLKY